MRNFAFNNGRSAYSSMDRIKDSGSFDWGSTPHGRTIFFSIVLIVRAVDFVSCARSVLHYVAHNGIMSKNDRGLN